MFSLTVCFLLCFSFSFFFFFSFPRPPSPHLRGFKTQDEATLHPVVMKIHIDALKDCFLPPNERDLLRKFFEGLKQPPILCIDLVAVR